MTYQEKAAEVTHLHGKYEAASKVAAILRNALKEDTANVITLGGLDHIKAEIQSLDEICDEAGDRLYDMLGDD